MQRRSLLKAVLGAVAALGAGLTRPAQAASDLRGALTAPDGWAPEHGGTWSVEANRTPDVRPKPPRNIIAVGPRPEGWTSYVAEFANGRQELAEFGDDAGPTICTYGGAGHRMLRVPEDARPYVRWISSEERTERLYRALRSVVFGDGKLTGCWAHVEWDEATQCRLLFLPVEPEAQAFIEWSPADAETP